MSSNKKIYFTAGPAKLPREVMLQVHDELLNYQGIDIGVMEMSHRSKEFDSIITDAEQNLRKLLQIPDNYAVLFMQGGARTQFDSVPMNLLPELDNCKLDYIVNGTWSKMAAIDAEKYANVQRQNSESFTSSPAKEILLDNREAIYRYYCDNETVQGVEFNYIPECSVPLICDMTSNFLSRPVDVSKYGVVFAGAQKNCGIAGLCLVIVRKDLIGKHLKITPTTQTYKLMHDNRSLLNTPLTFAIYVANLCFKWILSRGGLEAMNKLCSEKSAILYNYIENSNGFYTCPVEKSSRSRMNVVFLISVKDLDSKFIDEAKSAKLFELKGHRSVGGFRVSLYHGIEIEDVRRLTRFMEDFKIKYN